MARCRLCLKEKQLIKKSHIIPEFMYRDLYDENHKMIVFNPAEVMNGKGRIKTPSSGEYEGGLLCDDCDNRLLSIYENYASKVIYGGLLPTNESPVLRVCENESGLVFTNATNIDYKKTKLFFLSVLWRASISSRPLFSDVSLGEHEEVIRKMILNGDSGPVYDYPIFFLTLVGDKGGPRDVIAQPQKRKAKSGHINYVFIIGGMIYFYYINSENLVMPEIVITETIKPSNELNIYHALPNTSWDLILKFYGL